MPSKTLREAYLGKDKSDPNIDNKRLVKLHITQGIPFTFIEEDVVTNTQINSTTTQSVLMDSTIKNVLVDPDNPNRYIYITRVESSITHNIVVVYYDAKYEDIIIVPNLETLGDGDIDSPIRNNTFDLNCYVVSGKDNIKEGVYPGSVTINDLNLPETNSNINCSHLALTLYGIAPSMGGRRLRYDIDTLGKYALYSDRKLPLGVLDLGNVNDLFVDNNISLDMLYIYQSNVDMYRTKYIGNKKVTKAYILLDF